MNLLLVISDYWFSFIKGGKVFLTQRDWGGDMHLEITFLPWRKIVVFRKDPLIYNVQFFIFIIFIFLNHLLGNALSFVKWGHLQGILHLQAVSEVCWSEIEDISIKYSN